MARLDPQTRKYTSRAEVNFTTVLALAKIDALGAWGQRRVGRQGVCQTPCHHDHGQAGPPSVKIHIQGRSEFIGKKRCPWCFGAAACRVARSFANSLSP